MCLILFAYDCHPRYKLVVAQNRDEFFNRPTSPADFWSDNPLILAGRDQNEGGTWLGITRTGRFASLTNYRDPLYLNPQAPSRGRLVKEYLESDLDAEEYIRNLHGQANQYNGFSLLVGNFDSLHYFSNRGQVSQPVEPGLHGLSNSWLDVPWPKVTKGTKALQNCLQDKDCQVEQLFAIMGDREQPPDHELPQTGVSMEWERMLAPLYVESPDYGTRSATILLVERNNYVHFWERTFTPFQPDVWDEVHYEFQR